MTDYYEIALGLRKPKTIEDDIKLEKETKEPVKKKNHLELLTKIRNNKLKLVENNLMIDNDDNDDNDKPKLPNNQQRLPNKQKKSNKYSNQLIDNNQQRLPNNNSINNNNNNKELDDVFGTIIKNNKYDEVLESIKKNNNNLTPSINNPNYNDVNSVRKKLNYNVIDYDKIPIDKAILDTPLKKQIALDIEQLQKNIKDIINLRDFNYHYYDNDLNSNSISIKDKENIKRLRNTVFNNHDKDIKRNIKKIEKFLNVLYPKDDDDIIDKLKISNTNDNNELNIIENNDINTNENNEPKGNNKKKISNNKLSKIKNNDFSHLNDNELLDFNNRYTEEVYHLENKLEDMFKSQIKLEKDYDNDIKNNKYSKKEKTLKKLDYINLKNTFEDQIENIKKLIKSKNDDMEKFEKLLKKRNKEKKKNEKPYLFDTNEKKKYKANKKKIDDFYDEKKYKGVG